MYNIMRSKETSWSGPCMRYYLTLNIGASINQRKILIEMANIFSGSPITIWKVNLMAFT